VVQRDFQGGVNDFRSNSGTGVEARQPEITLQALMRYISKYFFSVSQRKGNRPGEAYERTGRMKESFIQLGEGLFVGI